MFVKPIVQKLMAASIVVTAGLTVAYFGTLLMKDVSYREVGFSPNYAKCDMFRTQCTIRLTESLSPFPGQFQQVYHILDTAYPWTKIEMHVDGNGGAVTSTLNLMGAVKASKGTVTMHVSSRAYSGHAFLLLSADKLDINDGAVILYHRSSLFGSVEKACARAKGFKDRGHDAQEKCIKVWNKHLILEAKYLYKLLSPILTNEEMQDVLQGHEVVLSGKEFKERLNGR